MFLLLQLGSGQPSISLSQLAVHSDAKSWCTTRTESCDVADCSSSQATSPAVVLAVAWMLRLSSPDIRVAGRLVLIIAGGVVVSFGDTTLNLTGVIYQATAILSNAIRVNLMQAFMGSSSSSLNVLACLYCLSPVGTLVTGALSLALETPHFRVGHIYAIGPFAFFSNAVLAFATTSATFLVVGHFPIAVLDAMILMEKTATKNIRIDTQPVWNPARYPSNFSFKSLGRE